MLPDLRALLLRFLPDRGRVDQLLPLAAGLHHDLFGLLAGLGNEGVALRQQLLGLLQLRRQPLAHSLHHFDGVLLIHQPAAAEGNARAVEHDLFKLVELFQHADPILGHLIGAGMSD